MVKPVLPVIKYPVFKITQKGSFFRTACGAECWWHSPNTFASQITPGCGKYLSLQALEKELKQRYLKVLMKLLSGLNFKPSVVLHRIPRKQWFYLGPKSCHFLIKILCRWELVPKQRSEGYYLHRLLTHTFEEQHVLPRFTQLRNTIVCNSKRLTICRKQNIFYTASLSWDG